MFRENLLGLSHPGDDCDSGDVPWFGGAELGVRD